MDCIKEIALTEIDKILRDNGRSLADFPPIPIPTASNVIHRTNRLIMEEMNYDQSKLEADHLSYMSSLTDEQQSFYNNIMEACYNGSGGVFFLNGYGGTGKTFLWNTLTASIRSRGDIVLAGNINFF